MAISRFITSIDAGESIRLFGDGLARRDFTYVDDVLDGMEAALTGPAGFDIINLGSARPVTLTELVAEIERATGKAARIVREADQPGDVPVTFADITKAERLLGYRARVPLDEGLRRSVAWHRSQGA